MIYDEDSEKESESEQNNVKSDNDEFEFIYDEEIAWSVEWTRSWFDKSDKFLTPFISHKYKPTKRPFKKYKPMGLFLGFYDIMKKHLSLFL